MGDIEGSYLLDVSLLRALLYWNIVSILHDSVMAVLARCDGIVQWLPLIRD